MSSDYDPMYLEKILPNITCAGCVYAMCKLTCATSHSLNCFFFGNYCLTVGTSGMYIYGAIL